MRKKTDYRQRLKLLKSGKPRIVVRKSLNRVIAQVVQYEPKGDVVLAEKTSKALSGFGWEGHGGNLPAAYLTGLLIGLEAVKRGIREAVIDIGMQRTTKGCALYAFSKGVADSGLEINISGDVVPSEERISGKHIADHIKKDVTGNFSAVKKKIIEAYKQIPSGS